MQISPSNNNLYNLSLLKQLCNNNQAVIKNILTAFCQQTPKLLHQLLQAYQQKNGELLSKTAHKLKPSIDYLQIESLKTVVREVERKANDSEEGLAEIHNAIFTLQNTLNLVVEELQKQL